jgi:hypothetical protein
MNRLLAESIKGSTQSTGRFRVSSITVSFIRFCGRFNLIYSRAEFTAFTRRSKFSRT